MEEPEPKAAPMGEGGSLGGVAPREGEAAGEEKGEDEEKGGSSNRSLSLSEDLSSGSAGKPERQKEKSGIQTLSWSFCTLTFDFRLN